ncbi:tripartite tricarboxylate transporter substrate binding protein [Diaphorobacter sp. HDW4A]|uniref:Bug family tripartite tricarboxylate transporter substrate binding protein n=1 Tax=Diaphorobacter sp. HDW4A TaxID=2714924 RepID=UPI00140D095A|nr:tripartite tricarboxylate transporter substrate binding protein [Diaphorobacter sp. HDW4A]QIL81136.1 tripartite tricarboxylate transporter substrate binding protein [Diaphorobacter sp. HDW4A]
MKALIRNVTLACLAAVSCLPALADSYPSKPVKVIVPYAAGGGTDIVARLIAQKLGERLGQSFIVENKSGAATQAGTVVVAKSPNDGYTLLMGTANLATNVPLFKKLPYDANKDLAPISLITKVPVYLFVASNSPIKSAKDVVTQSKANADGLSWASAGVGSIPNLAGELFRMKTQANMTHIPYKGSSESVVSVAGGQTAFAFDNLPPFAGQVKAGKVKPIAVSLPQRSKLTPDVPTLMELGIPVEAYSWWGMLAPAGTPTAIIDKLNKEIVAIVKEPDVQARFEQLGIEGVGGTPAEFSAHIKAETTKWSEVVKAVGIQPE